jgi:O-antigen biosynthesis protein
LGTDRTPSGNDLDLESPPHPLASQGDPSAAELTELVLAGRDALAEAVERHGANSKAAESRAGILRLLVERAVKTGVKSGETPLELAAQYADVFPSAEALEAGPAGRAAAVLGPLNTEVLRPQAEFNRALVEVLGQLAGAPATADRTWVRARLEPLAEPAAFRVQSHRDNLIGRLVDTAKRSWLLAAGPLFDACLQRQRAWNLAVLDALTSSRAGDAALEPLDISAGGDVDANRFVTAVFEKQERFNRHVAAMLRAGAGRATPVADYPAWLARREGERARAIEGALRSAQHPPRFSVLIEAASATPEQFETTLDALNLQYYPAWDFAVRGAAVNHPRHRAEAGLEGDWVTFLRAGDTLAKTALGEVAVAALGAPDIDLFYTDEDRLEANTRTLPFFKPDLSPALLGACDYVSHALFVRRAALADFTDPAQRHAAVVARADKPIGHVREALVSRATSGDRRADFAVASAPAPALTQRPLVSIIVPFRDKPELLEQLTRSLKNTRYPHYELLLVSNESREKRTHALLAALDDPRVRKLAWNHAFNYPAINNFAARHAKGELLVFLNNDIELTDPDWLEALAAQLSQPGVAAVGPKLLFPDGTLQHAGVVVGLGGFGGHPFAHLPNDGRWTPFGTADWPRDCLALTSACLMLRRADFEAIGGFDERFVVCGSDVDLCLRLRPKGRSVYTPRTTLVHHESASRAGSTIPASDFWESLRAYGAYLVDDPFFSPRLSLSSTEPVLRPEDEPPAIDIALRQLGAVAPRPTASAVSSGRVAAARRTQGLARALDCDAAAFAPRAQPTLNERPRKLTWLIPSFSHPFGGVHTLFRFADVWARDLGVENHFVIYDNPHVSPREIASRAGVLGPRSAEAFTVLPSLDAVAKLPPTDVLISTAWSSAYVALRHPAAGFRAYFVQDDESLFSAAGTLSALADNTYRFGFFGLFNGKGLFDHFHAQGMRGAWFEPSVDRELFHAQGRADTGARTRLFFYGRPSVDRNAFELGLEALRAVKAKRGDAVQFLCAGETWAPSSFDAEGVVENLGVLPYRETGALYRTIDVGLTFMMTRHPSYLPLELMACGATIVANANPHNGWLFADDENCLLAQPTVSCVAEKLDLALGHAGLRARLSAAAIARLGRGDWDNEARRTFEALAAAATGSSRA